MTPEEHPDWPRVQKLVKQFMEKIIESQEVENLETPILLDDFGIIGMATMQEEDGTQSEEPVAYYSTSKAASQVGLLTQSLWKAERHARGPHDD